MSKARTWTLGLVVAMILVVLAGWQLGISPITSQISLANAQASTIEASNAATQSKLAALKIQYAGIGKLQSKLDALRLSIPEQAAAASFLSEVTSLASKAGVSIESVTLADATLYQSASTSAANTATSTSTSTASTGATSTPAPSTAQATGVGAAGTSVSSTGLVAIQVTVSATGAYSAVQEFIGLVQTGTRLFVSNSVSFDGSAAAGTGGSASTVLSGNIFTLQGTSDQSTATGSGSGSTSTPTPYPTLTPTATPTATPTPTSTASTSKTGTSVKKSTPTPTPTPSNGS